MGIRKFQIHIGIVASGEQGMCCQQMGYLTKKGRAISDPAFGAAT
jgi:hypothetical protein